MKKYTITYGDMSADILSEAGAGVVRFECGGRPVLRAPESEAVFLAAPALYGTPIQLPCNRTRGGKFSFEGKTYDLGINEPAHGNHLHGNLMRQPFTVTAGGESSLTCLFESRDAAVYPFPFSLRVDFRLTDGGFFQDFRLTNTGTGRMPYTFGLHTVFVCRHRFSVPVATMTARDADFIPTGEMIPLTPEQETYRDGHEIRQDEVISGYFTSCGTSCFADGTEYRVSGFDRWVLYNGGGNSGFMCLEPQCGNVNGLNREGEHAVLAPGAETVFRTQIIPAR